MKIICLFSHPRTGTNYLHSVLQQWPSTLALGEIFHEKQAYGLKPAQIAALGQVAGQTFNGAADPQLIAWVRSHPMPVIDTLQRLARRKGLEALYLKVFPGQWVDGPSGSIPALARLPGFMPIVLQRRMFDVYVSYCKVAQIGIYKNADTTDVPIKLWADAFSIWAAESRAWYVEVISLLQAAGMPPMHVTYERDIDMDPVTLSTYWSGLLGVSAGAIDPSLALVRQDRTPSLAQKLETHEAFVAEAKRLGVWDLGMGGFA